MGKRASMEDKGKDFSLGSSSMAVEAKGGLPASLLLVLPSDLLLAVLSLLKPSDIIHAVGLTCRKLRKASVSDELWRLMLESTYGTVIQIAFGGRCPHPMLPLSWQQHFLEFRSLWMLLAKAEGRILFTINGHVYDATEYEDHHPGLPAFLHSASGTDASIAFALAGHSDNARRILRRFAVPALDAFQPRRRSSGCFGCDAASSIEKLGSVSGSGGRHAETGAANGISGGSSGGSGGGSGGGSSSGASRWRSGWRVARVLLRSPVGRQQLLDAACGLANAAVIDLERTGRDPVESQRKAESSAGLTRFLPVMWETAWRKTELVARMLITSHEAEGSQLAVR